MTEEDERRTAIADAVAAFDAGNHAWGRFLLYVLRPYHGEPPAPNVTPVREALQEVALSIPQAAAVDEIRAFDAALAVAGTRLATFLADLPPALRDEDALRVPDTFAEARAYLAPWAQ